MVSVTWGQLVEAEPRLARLLKIAQSTRSRPGFCANAVWYGYDRPEWLSLKGRASKLVGWERKGDPLLSAEKAYDVAYETIYHALPNCQHEGPCG